MKSIKWIVLFVALTLIMTFALTSALSASSNVNPEKGPPEFDKIVFVHYPKEWAPGKPEGTPGGKTEKEYIYSNYHWSDTRIPVDYYINLSGGVGTGDFRTGIQEGFQVWENEPNSYIDFNYIADSSFGISSLDNIRDGYNVVGFRDISGLYPDAIAVTQFWYNIATKELSEVDVAFNSNGTFSWWQNPSGESWAYGDTAGKYDVDVQNIMAHEAGHWLVLDDLYADNNIDKTMYGYSAEMDLIKRSLASGDAAGVQAIYSNTTPVEQGTMHVENINMWSSKSGVNNVVYTEVLIADSSGTPVPTAAVNITTTLPNNSTKTFSGETSAQGVVTFSLKSKLSGTYTSTVNNVSKDGWIYDGIVASFSWEVN